MTPAQFASCSEVFDNERRVLDAQFAYLRAVIAEPNRDRKKRNKPYAIDDFALFGEKAQEAAQKKEPQTWQSQRAYVAQFLHPFMSARANLQKKIEGS